MQGARPASDVSTTKSVGEFGIELPFISIKHQSKRSKLNHTLGELPSAATDLPKQDGWEDVGGLSERGG